MFSTYKMTTVYSLQHAIMKAHEHNNSNAIHRQGLAKRLKELIGPYVPVKDTRESKESYLDNIRVRGVDTHNPSEDELISVSLKKINPKKENVKTDSKNFIVQQIAKAHNDKNQKFLEHVQKARDNSAFKEKLDEKRVVNIKESDVEIITYKIRQWYDKYLLTQSRNGKKSEIITDPSYRLIGIIQSKYSPAQMRDMAKNSRLLESILNREVKLLINPVVNPAGKTQAQVEAERDALIARNLDMVGNKMSALIDKSQTIAPEIVEGLSSYIVPSGKSAIMGAPAGGYDSGLEDEEEAARPIGGYDSGLEDEEVKHYTKDELSLLSSAELIGVIRSYNDSDANKQVDKIIKGKDVKYLGASEITRLYDIISRLQPEEKKDSAEVVDASKQEFEYKYPDAWAYIVNRFGSNGLELSRNVLNSITYEKNFFVLQNLFEHFVGDRPPKSKAALIDALVPVLSKKGLSGKFLKGHGFQQPDAFMLPNSQYSQRANKYGKGLFGTNGLFGSGVESKVTTHDMKRRVIPTISELAQSKAVGSAPVQPVPAFIGKTGTGLRRKKMSGGSVKPVITTVFKPLVAQGARMAGNDNKTLQSPFRKI